MPWQDILPARVVVITGRRGTFENDEHTGTSPAKSNGVINKNQKQELYSLHKIVILR